MSASLSHSQHALLSLSSPIREMVILLSGRGAIRRPSLGSLLNTPSTITPTTVDPSRPFVDATGAPRPVHLLPKREKKDPCQQLHGWIPQWRRFGIRNSTVVSSVDLPSGFSIFSMVEDNDQRRQVLDSGDSRHGADATVQAATGTSAATQARRAVPPSRSLLYIYICLILEI